MAAISRANLVLSGSHAGVSIGEDGPSQMGLEDIAAFRAVHGSTVLHPCDANQTAKLVAALADRPGVGYLRTLRPATKVLYEPDETFEIGGWSIMDLLAHRVGWDFTNLKAAQEVQGGRLPGFYEYWDKDWRSYNALLVNLYKRADPAEQVDSLEASHERLVAYLETLPPSAFTTDYGVQFKGAGVTIERLLKTQIEDERQHIEQIRDFAHRKAR
jgi:hypothetical protein